MCYDGKVQVIVLVKYLCRNPRLRNDGVLFVFRPAWSTERNKWIVLQDGPLYTLFHARQVSFLRFRYVSLIEEEDQVPVADIGAALVEERNSPDEGAQYGYDWDEWMSDVSDA